MSYLSQNYTNPSVQGRLPDTIDRLVLGDLPHAGGILLSLLGLRVAVAPQPPVSPIHTWEPQLDDIRTATAPLPATHPDPVSPSECDFASHVAPPPRIPSPPLRTPSSSATSRPAYTADVTPRSTRNAGAQAPLRPPARGSSVRYSSAWGSSESTTSNTASLAGASHHSSLIATFAEMISRIESADLALSNA